MLLPVPNSARLVKSPFSDDAITLSLSKRAPNQVHHRKPETKQANCSPGNPNPSGPPVRKSGC